MGKNESIIINSWMVNTGSGYLASGPVPWDYPAEKGGINAGSYDGEGTYTSRVVIPVDFKNKQLALFIQGVDDVDVTFMNGIKIGSTGSFPEIPGSISGYVSAWRNPRLYPIPQNLINYGAENIIEVKVFDFSGRGGFAGDYPPEIGSFNYLEKRVSALHNMNNIPRIAVMTIMFFFLVKYYLGFVASSGTGNTLLYVYRHIYEGLNPVFFIRKSISNENTTPVFSKELKFSYLCASVSLFCFIAFMFYELTFKDSFSVTQAVPVWHHIYILYTGFMTLLFLLHGDIFTTSAGEKKGFIYAGMLIFGIITHPIIFFCYYIYIHFIPVTQVSNDFPARGSLMMITIVICMLISTLIQVIKLSLEFGDSEMIQYRKLMIGEIILRLVFFTGITATVIIFLITSNVLFMHASTIACAIIIMYLAFSIKLQKKRDKLYRFFDDNSVRTNARILSSEDKIQRVILFINQNYTERITRDDIADATGMSADLLSRTFKSYTGKTITDYINEIRVKNSAVMLSGTDKTIIEISFDSGFNSVRTFNRVFANYMKVSPTQYRLTVKE